MNSRVEKAEFFENKHVRAVPDEGRTWSYCEDYEVHRSSDNAIEVAYLRPKYRPKQHDRWKEYKPLQETPDLFLRFARLYEQEPSEESARDWARRYGLLGYTPRDHMRIKNLRVEPPSFEETQLRRRAEVPSWEDIRPPSGYLTTPADGTIDVFRGEVERAAGVLAMYEAWLSRDNAFAKEVILESSPFIGGRVWGYVEGNSRTSEVAYVDDLVKTVLGGSYLQYCLPTASYVVEGTVNDFCYHLINLGSNWEEASQVVDVWAFENLLGAMYLQMFWLMGSSGNTTRCDWCGRLISLEKPYPEAKKPPQHKRFCDRYCRQKWNYHHRVKPKRKGEVPSN